MGNGRMAHVVKKTPGDCEIVIVNGTRYRNVIDLLYEESKYRKVYPTDKEWKKIEAYKLRRAQVERDKWKKVYEEDRRQKDLNEWKRRKKLELEKKEEKERIERRIEEEKAERATRRQAKRKAYAEAKKKEREKAARYKIAKKEEERNKVKLEILKALDSGASRKELHDIHGFSFSQIQRSLDRLSEEGLYKKIEKPIYTADEDALILKMRKDKKTFREIDKAISRVTGSANNRYRYLIRGVAHE